jgi:hypothetical protein
MSRPLSAVRRAESLDVTGAARHGAVGRGDRRQVRGRQVRAAGEHHCCRVDVGLARCLLKLNNPRGGGRGWNVGGSRGWVSRLAWLICIFPLRVTIGIQLICE